VQTFAIIDAARDDRLFDLITTAAHTCLFAGSLAPELRRASPHLAELAPGSALAQAWNKEGRSQCWGITCRSSAELNFLARHFRQFVQAKLPDGKIALFRFYDPRVWRDYLPTCNEFELRQWFRNVDSFAADAGDGRTITYSLDDGKLIRTRTSEDDRGG
jgi:hypothetical protein